MQSMFARSWGRLFAGMSGTMASGAAVCPVDHGSQGNNTSSSTPTDAGVCPIDHSSFVKDVPAAGGVCPIDHSSFVKDSPATNTSGGVCPIDHSSFTKDASPSPHTQESFQQTSQEEQTAAPKSKPRVCPMAKKPGMTMMPDDDEDNLASDDDDSLYHPSDPAEDKLKYPDFKIGGHIPATGRGNSDDGAHWVSPTTREMFRALRRKDKEISELDAFDVAATHGDVVDATWQFIMEYEQLHVDKCKDITLKRFEGMFGIPTFKSSLGKVLGYGPPFDRHDWYIDRCGQEVRYIIDYYSMDGAFDHDYSIDVRPDMKRLENIYDRIRIAYRRYKNDESFW